ncbi:hypothetical protein Tco_0063835, partial [Tanacetum coccineum]
MVDDAAAPSIGASQLRPSSGSVPLFRDVSGDAIHVDLFLFSVGETPFETPSLKNQWNVKRNFKSPLIPRELFSNETPVSSP